jgi:hypothetical protein
VQEYHGAGKIDWHSGRALNKHLDDRTVHSQVYTFAIRATAAMLFWITTPALFGLGFYNVYIIGFACDIERRQIPTAFARTE